jgi:hypothetical protein
VGRSLGRMRALDSTAAAKAREGARWASSPVIVANSIIRLDIIKRIQYYGAAEWHETAAESPARRS